MFGLQVSIHLKRKEKEILLNPTDPDLPKS